MADLYALAVLIFALYMGKMPFNSAVTDDILFNCITKRDLNKFWRLHEIDVTNPSKTISAEFKDLISNMLAY